MLIVRLYSIVVLTALEDAMKNKYNMVLTAEESFAREAALSLIVRRPVTAWHYLIPGMFIFDHLKRNEEIRRYTEAYLSPRKIAIATARAILEGEDREERFSQCEEEIVTWLKSLRLYSPNLHAALVKEAHILTDHYKSLLTGEGDLYPDLIINVYKTREEYTSFLRGLTNAEDAVNEALKEKLGNTEALKKRLTTERMLLDKLRKQAVDITF